MSEAHELVLQVVFLISLLALPLVIWAAMRSRAPLGTTSAPWLSRNDHRWLMLLGTVLGLEVLCAGLLCLTVFLGVVGWPWLWLSWSMLRSVDRLHRGALSNPMLLLVQCLGVAIAILCVEATIISDGAARVTTGRMTWLIVGPLLLALHLRVAWIARRVPRRAAPIRGHILL